MIELEAARRLPAGGDVYPDRTGIANNPSGVLGFPYYSPFGFSGRYLYVRAGLNW